VRAVAVAVAPLAAFGLPLNDRRSADDAALVPSQCGPRSRIVDRTAGEVGENADGHEFFDTLAVVNSIDHERRRFAPALRHHYDRFAHSEPHAAPCDSVEPIRSRGIGKETAGAWSRGDGSLLSTLKNAASQTGAQERLRIARSQILPGMKHQRGADSESTSVSF